MNASWAVAACFDAPSPALSGPAVSIYVIRKIGKAAGQRGVVWELFKEGGNHTIYLLGGERIPVPRHTEIDEGLAEKMFRECEEVLGRGWWR